MHFVGVGFKMIKRVIHSLGKNIIKFYLITVALAI